jgi:metal-dependent amidase/aminoacylase/carboxypeptidase family protein
VADLKKAVTSEVTRRTGSLLSLSHAIHRHAETAFQEHASAETLRDWLGAEGFAVQGGVAGLPTSFVARRAATGPAVAFVAEYDALPGLGHACGHNISSCPPPPASTAS